MIKFRKGDFVLVNAGKYKGKTGVIKKFLREKNRVIIDKLIMNKKHTKPNNLNKDGGIIDQEGSLHISNISYIISKKTSKTIKISRIGFRIKNDKKIRYTKKNNKELL